MSFYRKQKALGKVRNATPIQIDGIKFRSKLEGYCYKKLKQNNIPFKYEEDKFILVPPFEFNNDSFELVKRGDQKEFKRADPRIRPMSYTPDFTNLDHGWIIECKGNPNDAFPLRWKLFKKYIMDNDLKLDLFLPRNQKQVNACIEQILRKINNKKK